MVVFLRIVTLKRLQRDTNPPEWGGGVYWYGAFIGRRPTYGWPGGPNPARNIREHKFHVSVAVRIYFIILQELEI